MTQYYCAEENQITSLSSLPSNALPFVDAMARVLPPQIGSLHQGLASWGQHGKSPGPVSPDRIWIDTGSVATGDAGTGCKIYFAFKGRSEPQPLMQTGLAAEIAAWLVLLDRWMETYVVIARARGLWTPDELASTLTFLTPAFLPPAVVQFNPQWDQVATAVALSVADGPLAGSPDDKHWASS